MKDVSAWVQPDCCLKIDFQKVDQHAGGRWLIHDTKRRKDVWDPTKANWLQCPMQQWSYVSARGTEDLVVCPY